MSDITTVQGLRIKKAIYNGRKTNLTGVSKWERPDQELTSRVGLSLCYKLKSMLVHCHNHLQLGFILLINLRIGYYLHAAENYIEFIHQHHTLIITK